MNRLCPSAKTTSKANEDFPEPEVRDYDKLIRWNVNIDVFKVVFLSTNYLDIFLRGIFCF